MKMRTKVLILVLGAIVLVPVMGIGGLFVTYHRMEHNGRRGQTHLFLETDYNDLQAACQELSSRVTSGQLQRGKHNLRFRHPFSAEAASFPKIILDLEPYAVEVYEDNVDIAFWAWIDRGCGVRTYPRGPEGEGVKLADGLWYYDWDYSDLHPDHKKQIDDLIEKGRRLRQGGAVAGQKEQ